MGCALLQPVWPPGSTSCRQMLTACQAPCAGSTEPCIFGICDVVSTPSFFFWQAPLSSGASQSSGVPCHPVCRCLKRANGPATRRSSCSISSTPLQCTEWSCTQVSSRSMGQSRSSRVSVLRVICCHYHTSQPVQLPHGTAAAAAALPVLLVHGLGCPFMNAAQASS